MNNSEELECCEVVLQFLGDPDDKHSQLFYDIMANAFKKHWESEYKNLVNSNVGIKCQIADMVSFTEYLNFKYKICDILWIKSAREFFATEKSRIFYKQIIRNNKLKLILNGVT